MDLCILGHLFSGQCALLSNEHFEMILSEGQRKPRSVASQTRTAVHVAAGMTVVEERNVTPSDGYTLRGTRDGNGVAVDVTHVYVRRSNVGSLNLAICRVEGFANIYASYSFPN